MFKLDKTIAAGAQPIDNALKPLSSHLQENISSAQTT
jgi:hypothetical protein